MEYKWDEIVKVIIASGVFSTIFSFIFKFYIEGKFKHMLDKQLKEYETELAKQLKAYEAELGRKTAIVIASDVSRIKAYEDISFLVNSTRKLCQKIEADFNNKNNYLKILEIKAVKLEELIHRYEFDLRKEMIILKSPDSSPKTINLHTQIHTYKHKLLTGVCKEISNYEKANGNAEKAFEIKEDIIDSINYIVNECNPIINNICTLIKKEKGLN